MQSATPLTYLIPLLFVVLVGILLAIIRKVPEKSALLLGLGVAMTFIIGLVFTALTPSFNENWSTNTAKDAWRYHAIYTTTELDRYDRALAAAKPGQPVTPPALYTGDLNAPGVTLVGYTRQEEHGRRIYQREGCMYCHSQQIRPLVGEITRYSIGTSIAPIADEREYIWDQPHFLGTRRIGPDLSRVGGKYSDDWHYSHFFYPRQMVPGSIMPAFTWMFTFSPDDANHTNPIPNKDVQDLVAYVQSLGYGRQVYDATLNGGKGGWRTWLKPQDQQYTQALGQTQVNAAAKPVHGGDPLSPTNRAAPVSPASPTGRAKTYGMQ